MESDRMERIRARAYELWEQDGGQSDEHERFWLQAEQEIDEANAGTGDRFDKEARDVAEATRGDNVKS